MEMFAELAATADYDPHAACLAAGHAIVEFPEYDTFGGIIDVRVECDSCKAEFFASLAEDAALAAAELDPEDFPF